jgi:hypothetical protein
MVMEKKEWITTFLFKEFLSFFKKLIPPQSTFVNSRWAWQPCYLKKYITNKRVRV